MGPTGPCGPCTERFYDHGDKIWGGPPGSVDEDGDRFIEIWNLVFMQFEQLASGERLNLPKQSIDTGMGLERIAAVLQKVHSNYEIDLFVNLLQAAKAAVDGAGGRGLYQGDAAAADDDRTLLHRAGCAQHGNSGGLRACQPSAGAVPGG